MELGSYLDSCTVSRLGLSRLGLHASVEKLLVGKENETFLIRVWKLLFDKHVFSLKNTF